MINNLKNSRTTLLTLLALSSALLLSITANAAQTRHHHGSNAPIGIMGDHLMHENEWMLSYRFMNMNMEGNRTGTKRVNVSNTDFMVAPRKMKMAMHMLGGMFGINNDMTVMTMLPVIHTDMDLEIIAANPMQGTLFNTESSGIGDLKISAAWKNKTINALLSAGLSVPTGSIDERSPIPVSAGVAVHSPYPMQLGSGTYDVLLGITRTGLVDNLNWGVQARATIRTGANDNDYTLGNVFNIAAWLGTSITESIAGSLRINASNWENIDGSDTKLAAAPTVPTKNTNIRGGTRIDTLLGLDTTLGNNVLGIEIGIPVYQNLDGPQLENDLTIVIGWQVSY